MNYKKALSFSLCIAILLTIIVGCGTNAATTATTTSAKAASGNWDETWKGRNSIKIGALVSFTGADSVESVPAWQSCMIAFEEENKIGGINGKQIEWVTYDYAASTEQIVKGANYLVEQGVDAMIIGAGTNGVMSCGQIINDAGIPAIYYGVAPKTNQQGWKYLVRSVANSSYYYVYMREMLKSLKIKKIAFITNVDEWGQSGLKYWTPIFKEDGIQMVASESYTNEDIDFTGQITKIIASKPQIVLAYSQNAHLPLIMKQLRQVGYDGLVITAEPGASSAIRTIAGNSANGLLFSSGSVAADSLDDPKLSAVQRKYSAAYVEKYKKLSGYDSSNRLYDAGRLLVESIKKAKSLNHNKINDALHSLKDFELIGGNVDCTVDPGEAFSRANAFVIWNNQNIPWATWFKEYGQKYIVN